MKISKSMFKNLMRCKNFASLLNMHQNRAAHDVKILDDLDEINLQKLIDDVQVEEDVFHELKDQVLEMFEKMFDEETGEDLTEVTNEQIKAFAEIFIEVEELAIKQAEKQFGKPIHASVDTKEQKKFSFSKDGHEYYCYLDGYLEDDDVIRVFEVKSSTSRNMQNLQIYKPASQGRPALHLPVFEFKNGVMEYIARDYIGQTIDGHEVLPSLIDPLEVKLTNPYNKECGKYIFDISVERYIVENYFKQNKDFVPNIKYYLILLNTDYYFDGTVVDGKRVYGTSKDGEELFRIYDVTTLTEYAQEAIEKYQKQICISLDELTYSDDRLSNSCSFKQTTQCKFLNVCFRHVQKDGSILEYLGRNNAFKSLTECNKKGDRKSIPFFDMINTKHYTIPDCRPYLEKVDNIYQHDCYVNHQVYIDKARIRYALSQIKYPIYHLDFESYNCPLPRFKGEKPYRQSLFQYSLHIEKEEGVCDIEKNHLEFLAPDHEDHREEFIKKMIKDIDLSNGGTVLVYNQNFEKARINELIENFPKYKDELEKINNHVFDLYYVLRGNKDMFAGYMAQSNIPSYTYYNNKLHGSFSIKKVLPIFTDLTYSNLVVKNGTQAVCAYGELPNLTPKEYEEKYQALRVYCRQDTWAMVEILRGLRKEVKDM